MAEENISSTLAEVAIFEDMVEDLADLDLMELGREFGRFKGEEAPYVTRKVLVKRTNPKYVPPIIKSITGEWVSLTQGTYRC